MMIHKFSKQSLIEIEPLSLSCLMKKYQTNQNRGMISSKLEQYEKDKEKLRFIIEEITENGQTHTDTKILKEVITG